MATKKVDFTQNANKVQTTIAEATGKEQVKERKTYSPEEAAQFLAELKTAGRKGVKLPRINMAFAPDLYDYVRTMSKVTGQTLTEFVNLIVRQYMLEHSDLYEQAKAFRDSL